jgi:hypothetical protein
MSADEAWFFSGVLLFQQLKCLVLFFPEHEILYYSPYNESCVFRNVMPAARNSEFKSHTF